MLVCLKQHHYSANVIILATAWLPYSVTCASFVDSDQPGPEVIQLFMLNSAEHKIYHAHKY